MQPATFGLGGQDVLDEEYRKAPKMDTSQFCTTFSPYELGIIDLVAQTLLPSIKGFSMNRTVRAELYKLNVYSAPSGKFRAHVDTPRALNHFGTLVICLPLAHDGGELQIRHRGRMQTFDWSKAAGVQFPSIQWAAFYSDCEHEVLEVRAGHRITLTYNLFAAPGNDFTARAALALNPMQFPFHAVARDLLAKSFVLPEGGFMGFYTLHSYPHTSDDFCLANSLKGIDMVIWLSFITLGYDVSLRPVIMGDVCVQDHEEYMDTTYDSEPPARNYIGIDFGVDVVDNRVEGEYDMTKMLHAWAGSQNRIKDEQVTWINGKGNEEPQIRYMAYGNEAEAMVAYSCCAILVKVPPYNQRT